MKTEAVVGLTVVKVRTWSATIVRPTVDVAESGPMVPVIVIVDDPADAVGATERVKALVPALATELGAKQP